MAKEWLTAKHYYTAIQALLILSLSSPVHAESPAQVQGDCLSTCSLRQLISQRAPKEQLKLEKSAANHLDEVLSIPSELTQQRDKLLSIQLQDINFDGNADLSVTLNEPSDLNTFYWLFNPNQNQFEYCDLAPLLKIDILKKQLYFTSRATNSKVYQTTYYQLESNRLKAVSSERSEATAQSGIFKKSRYQIQNGQPKLVKVEFAYGPSGI